MERNPMYTESSKRQHVPLTPEQQEAVAAGYGQLTTSYSSNEEHMMTRAIQQLEKSNIPIRLVKDQIGTQIWRYNLRALPRH